MGKYSKGILGAFSGKVGTVIGSSWRGIDYMRSLAKKRNNALATPAQLEQQTKFGMITKFLSPIRPLVEEGFKNVAIRQTGYNGAVSYNVKNGISGVYPSFILDYSMICISRGDLTGIIGSGLTTTAASVTVSWDDNSGIGSATATDQLIVMVYSPYLKEAVYRIGGGITRTDLNYTLPLPASFANQDVHVWVAFKSGTNSEISGSQYLGEITIA